MTKTQIDLFPPQPVCQYHPTMRNAKEVLDQQFLEMRWRCLSLAADLDRLARAPGGAEIAGSDPRLKRLSQAIAVLLEPSEGRAEKVQRIFSDSSPVANSNDQTRMTNQ